MFDRILVANRGEIALRVIRACRTLGVEAVGIYSDADVDCLHVELADEVHNIGPPEPHESYLNIERIVETAVESGCDALHPGYGFLSENPKLAEECRRRNVVFIGPDAASMEQMGDKLRAKQKAAELGVPVLPGGLEGTLSHQRAEEVAEEIGYPVLLKAAAGGGGRGMRLVAGPSRMQHLFEVSQREARSAFGDGRLYVEKALTNSKHVEVQVMADEDKVLHFFERECSIQRRYQKLIEEAPSPSIDESLRQSLIGQAVRIIGETGYRNVGTVEFLLSEGEPHFLEVNSRVQVEHPVTEMITGVDLIGLQIRLSAEGHLPIEQEEIERRGHAVECRVYAEDPFSGFKPSPGEVLSYRPPAGDVRVESHMYSGYEVPTFYDTLVSKVITWGRSRREAIEKMKTAIAEYVITGVSTNLVFHEEILSVTEFDRGTYDTSIADRITRDLEPTFKERDLPLVASALYHYLQRPKARSRVGGEEPRDAWSAVAKTESVATNQLPARWPRRRSTE